MFRHDCPPSGETCNYATAPSIKKTWRDYLSIDMLLSAVSVLVVVQSISEIREGLMNNPVYAAQLHSQAINFYTYAVYKSLTLISLNVTYCECL
jgi:hypothetical protein